MKIAILQLDSTVGAVQSNVDLIIREARKAYTDGADIVLTSELALSGAPASDLLLRPDFLHACKLAVNKIADALSDCTNLYLLLGHPEIAHNPSEQQLCYNAASLIYGGEVKGIYTKQNLCNDGGACESRYFLTQENFLVFDVKGVRYGVLIGDEATHIKGNRGAAQVTSAGAQVLLALVAQPFMRVNGIEERVGEVAQAYQVPIIVAHGVGAQDGIVFAGGSFAVDQLGGVQMRAVLFDETICFVDLLASDFKIRGDLHSWYSKDETLWRALVLGLKSYFKKNKFAKVVLGLSGGMDSALVLTIAVDALGADHVLAVMMPSEHTSKLSLQIAREITERLGVQYEVVPIIEGCLAAKNMLSDVFLRHPSAFSDDLTEENVQARMRGVILMAISNRIGALVLACGNKSEVATGYCTLYGDTVGGYSVIKDVPKTRVYELAQWRNQYDVFGGGVSPIPKQVITRPPSAELREDQTDQDSLPSYEVVDGIVDLFLEKKFSIEDIINAGYTKADVEKVVRLIKISEYKRQQSPLGTKVTPCSFGVDWRYPVTSKF